MVMNLWTESFVALVSFIIERSLVISVAIELVDNVLHHPSLWRDNRWVLKQMCARVGERIELLGRLAIVKLLLRMLLLSMHWTRLRVMHCSLRRGLFLLVVDLLLLLVLEMVLRLFLMISERGRRLLSSHELLLGLFALLVLDPGLFLLETPLLGLKTLNFTLILLLLAPLGLELETILLFDLLLERTLDLHLLLELAASFAFVIAASTTTWNPKSSKATTRWIGSETSTVLLRLARELLVLRLLVKMLLVLVKVLSKSLFLLILLVLLKVHTVLTAVEPNGLWLQGSAPVTKTRLLLTWEHLWRIAVSLVSKVRIEAIAAAILLLLLLLRVETIVAVWELGLEALRRVLKPQG